MAASLGGNWWLYDQLGDARTKLGEAQADKRNAEIAAQTCSDSVTKLQAAAELQAKVAEPKIEIAKVSEQAHATKAQIIFRTRPALPNDGCKSSAMLAREWVKSRATK